MRQHYFLLLMVSGFAALSLMSKRQHSFNVHFPTSIGPIYETRGPANVYSNVSSGKGKRKAPKAGASTNHKGIDYRAPCGTPVPAKQAGTVTKAGTGTGYGKVVAISTGRCRAIYAHLSSISVRVGQRVAKGKVIGKVGKTGIATGCHLHYENCSQLYGNADELEEFIPADTQMAELLSPGGTASPEEDSSSTVVPWGTVTF